NDYIYRSLEPTDSGIYECQVSSTPHLSHRIHLSVKEPETVILGSPDIFVDQDSTINLTCIVSNTEKHPHKVDWLKNGKVVSYLGPRTGVSLVTDKSIKTVVSLVMSGARSKDSGTYSCVPDNAPTSYVNLHIINGEKTAELSGTRQLTKPSSIFTLCLSCLYLYMYL
ncbi:kin of IRRE-like protein 3, partial [Eurytemora carolleeae]|uniref:kin of IRRE-like protein 3 n=1 Tax=Eurytemora carolleeae TaxID=1294199 RepID=UPI000C78FF2F